MVRLVRKEGPMSSSRLLSLVHETWPRAVSWLERPWEAPEAIAREILTLLQSSVHWAEEILGHVEVIGSPDHYILCITDDVQAIFCSSQRGTALAGHPFIQELVEQLHL